MCDPATIAVTAMVVGGGLQAYGQVQAGQDEARIEAQNARNADQAAIDAERRGDIEEQAHRDKVRAMLGTQRATFAANNVDSNTGSALGVLTDTVRFGELDALTIRNNAAREAWGYRTEAASARARGHAAKRAGNLGGFGTALTSGAQAYGMWKKRGT